MVVALNLRQSVCKPTKPSLGDVVSLGADAMRVSKRSQSSASSSAAGFYKNTVFKQSYNRLPGCRQVLFPAAPPLPQLFNYKTISMRQIGPILLRFRVLLREWISVGRCFWFPDKGVLRCTFLS